MYKRMCVFFLVCRRNSVQVSSVRKRFPVAEGTRGAPVAPHDAETIFLRDVWKAFPSAEGLFAAPSDPQRHQAL